MTGVRKVFKSEKGLNAKTVRRLHDTSIGKCYERIVTVQLWLDLLYEVM